MRLAWEQVKSPLPACPSESVKIPRCWSAVKMKSFLLKGLFEEKVLLVGFCLFPKQWLLNWLRCSSLVWLAGLHHQLLIFIFSAIFVLSSLALSRCYLAKAVTLCSFIYFSTVSLYLFFFFGYFRDLCFPSRKLWTTVAWFFAHQGGLLVLSPALLGFLLPTRAA